MRFTCFMTFIILIYPLCENTCTGKIIFLEEENKIIDYEIGGIEPILVYWVYRREISL